MDTSSFQMNDGTFTKRTPDTSVPSHSTNASMNPQGASMPTRVSGDVRSTQPSSTAAVADRDDAVPAVWAVIDILHEDDAQIRALAHRLSEQAPVHITVPPGLEHDRSPDLICIFLNPGAAIQDGLPGDSGCTARDDPERLASRMGLYRAEEPTGLHVLAPKGSLSGLDDDWRALHARQT